MKDGNLVLLCIFMFSFNIDVNFMDFIFKKAYR